ncbi:MAG: glycine/betaine/sarcosine/D-proline family reductase selenoprotein B [Deltaproteobacteria bacterium]|nr:glycine/betaine/sarcosine/D-proline family reductase selenoprotein B [Deltaproteobacteria bacterium]
MTQSEKSLGSRLAFWLFRLPVVQRFWSRGFQTEAGADEMANVPWVGLKKPLAECRVALVTTGGVHLVSEKPFDMGDPQGDASYRVIPSDTPAQDLMITHDYYDHKDADADIDVVLPLRVLRSLSGEDGGEGVIGKVAPRHYSLMGHMEGPHLEKLRKETAPEVARRLSEDGVDVVLFTPA